MCMHALLLQSCLAPCDPMDTAPQAPLSRQEYWSGWPRSAPGAFLPRGWSLRLSCLLRWQAGVLPLAPPTWEAYGFQLSKL